jgi:thiamine-monophosphate kinase
MREFSLLEHVFSTAGEPGGHVIIGPGDDMAVVELGGRRLLAAIDQVVAGRHFDAARTPDTLVGRKAITRSLSDIAAMAAVPTASLVAVVLPRGFGEGRACRLFDSMRETAARYACPLIGGDIAIAGREAPALICSCVVLAEPGPAGAIGRDGARVGDTIYVTGVLGGSVDSDGGGHHLTFEPRITEAIALAEALGSRLHAMIDISDGLGRDAGHIAERSGVGIELSSGAVPCRDGADWRAALADGEDYELCFAAEGEVPAGLGDLPVTAVGRVVERSDLNGSLVCVRDGDRLIDAAELGWEHAG